MARKYMKGTRRPANGLRMDCRPRCSGKRFTTSRELNDLHATYAVPNKNQEDDTRPELKEKAVQRKTQVPFEIVRRDHIDGEIPGGH